jgi:hypothetical protein
MGVIAKIRCLGEKVVAKSGLAFWECSSHVEFTHFIAQGKGYRKTKLNIWRF